MTAKHSTLKASFLTLLICLVGCGGNFNQPVSAVSRNGEPITATSVFSNVAETWTFQNGFGDISWIDVIPVDENHTVWHYRKNADRAYWAPNVAGAELYFFLEKDSSGAWYSTGGHILMPQGCSWCLPDIHAPVDFTYSVAGVPGHPRPYLILADSGTSVDTIFPDAGVENARWATKMYTMAHLQEWFLVSEQWELSCGHERWWFKPGRGLWYVEPLDQGACVNVDPQLNMTRID